MIYSFFPFFLFSTKFQKTTFLTKLIENEAYHLNNFNSLFSFISNKWKIMQFM